MAATATLRCHPTTHRRTFAAHALGRWLSLAKLGLRTQNEQVTLPVAEGDRIPLSDGGIKNEYDKNIQICELNVLNAGFAVVRFKKLFGFYDDRREEHYSTYAIGRNDTNNEDPA